MQEREAEEVACMEVGARQEEGVEGEAVVEGGGEDGVRIVDQSDHAGLAKDEMLQMAVSCELGSRVVWR